MILSESSTVRDPYIDTSFAQLDGVTGPYAIGCSSDQRPFAYRRNVSTGTSVTDISLDIS